MVLLSSTVVIAILSALTIIISLLFTIYKRKASLRGSLINWAVINRATPLVASNKTSTKAGSAGKNTLVNKNKSSNNNNSPKLKQVHFADIVSVSPGDEHSSSKQKQNELTTPGQILNTYKATTKKTLVKHNVANGKSSELPNANAEIKSSHLAEINNNNGNNNGSNHAMPLGCESPADEIDSSVLMEVFNPTKAGMNAAVKKKQAQRQSKVDASFRKRHSSDSNQSSYSSEQLFKMIAASSLSRDEVEMAVETLLNKLESGETDWQRPKSDPLHRLKNQLRNCETALATETQNHEQTRARLVELKNQVQEERSTKSSLADELIEVKNQLQETRLALERAHVDLLRQRDESSKAISKLEEDNTQLQNLLNSSNVHCDELYKLRHEFNENVEQLQRYEAANESLKKRVHELETNLRTSEAKLDQIRADKQQDDYEACAKISELQSDRNALEKALKDHIMHLKEVSQANKLLEKSLNEAQISNSHQQDMIKRLNDEKVINETSMKRTLFEMELELRKLHERLGSKLATNDEKLDQYERELTDAGQREQKLKSKMKQLREGLSELFPELGSSVSEQANSDDWVHQYLIALRQLTATVDELRSSNGNDRHNKVIGDDQSMDSPSKRSIKSSLSVIHSNGKSSRVGSPTSNGRSSRASTNRDHDKRLMETKLVEPHECIAKSDEDRETEANKTLDGDSESGTQRYQQQINDLILNQKKLEFQIRVGLDSFRLEQKRVKQLEDELSIYKESRLTKATVS